MKERNYFCWLSQRVKNTRGATYAQHTRNLCAMLLVLFMGVGQMWAIDYYTPTDDEVVYLCPTSSTLTTHGSIGNAANTYTFKSGQTIGNPEGAGTVSKNCIQLKYGNSKKTLVVNVSGCSSVILYHNSHSSRYIHATLTPSVGSATTQKGTVSTTSTTYTLDGKMSYSILFVGCDGSDTNGGDMNVGAIKLIKYVDPGCETPTVTFSAAKTLAEINGEVALTFSSSNTNAVSYSIKKGGAATADATVTDGKFKATVAGTYTVTATQDADAGGHCAVEKTVTIKVASLLTGWVVFDGLVDEVLRTSPVTKDAVSMTYETASSSIVDAGSKTLEGTTRAYSKLIQISKSTGGYLKFTIPDGYSATFTHAFSGTGNRTIILASAKINSTSSEGYIATLCSATSGTIKWGEYTTPLAAGDYYICDCNNGNWQIAELVFNLVAATKYTVTYDLNGGSGTTPTETDKAEGAKFNLHNGTTSITAPTDKEFSKWVDQDANEYDGGAEFTMPGKNVKLTAKWVDAVTRYTVTYDLNGGEGDAPTETDKAAAEVFALAAAPIRAGHNFTGWLCDIDGAVKAAGANYTMTAANTKFTAQWEAYVACVSVVPATEGESPAAAGDPISVTGTGATFSMLKDQTSGKTGDIAYSTSGLLFANASGVGVVVTLDHLMKAGTVITATILADYKENNNRGLLLHNASGTKKADWVWKPAPDALQEEKVFTYTVVADDGLAGNNVFRIVRSTNAWLKSLTVSNCGAELIYYDLTSAVDPSGKGSVTLSAASLLEGETATATYAISDENYEFDEWQISGTGATLSGAEGDHVTVTMGSADAVVTLKLKEKTGFAVTYKANNGTEEADVEEPKESTFAANTFTAPEGKMFAGWNTQADGEGTNYAVGATVPAATIVYAKWVVDPTIRLIKNDGTLNTVNFVTGGTLKDDGPFTVEAVEYAKNVQFGNSCSGVSSIDNLNKAVIYHSTTNATKVTIVAYNNYTGGSTANLLYAVVPEGTTTASAITKTLNKSTGGVYEVNMTGRSTLYIYAGHKEVRICQVSVEENGTANAVAPAVGYSVNLNKQRPFLTSGAVTEFEGIEYKVSSNYKPLNGQVQIQTLETNYISFEIPEGETRQLQLTTSNTNKYTVSKTLGDNTESKKVSGNQNINLTEGVWYINPQGSNVNITNITFAAAPDALTVTFKDGATILKTQNLFSGDKAVALDPAPTKEGYRFVEWRLSGSAYDFDAEVTKNIQLDAAWQKVWTVTFDADGGSDVEAAIVDDNTAVAEPTAPEKAGHNFVKWQKEGADYDFASLVKSNITLKAVWAEKEDDPSLKALAYDGNAIDLESGVDNEGVLTFTYELPYKGEYVDGKLVPEAAAASAALGSISFAGNKASFRVTSHDGPYKDYAVVFTNAAKDMLCLVWADMTGDNALTLDEDKSALDIEVEAKGGVKKESTPSEYMGYTGYKFNTSGAYVALKDGNFKAGDRVDVFVVSKINAVIPVFKAADGLSTSRVEENTTTMVQGLNSVSLTSDATSLYLTRKGDFNGWNPHIAYVAVYRACPVPVVETISFNGVAGVVEDASITAEIPYSTNLATMSVEVSFLSNDPASTNGVLTSNEGAWKEGENTYVVTDKDGDSKTYTVTLSRAEVSHDATLSELTVEGYNIDFDAEELNYSVQLPYGSKIGDLPEVTYTLNHSGATAVKTNATALPGVTKIIVTAEDETTEKTYKVNFSVNRTPSVAIFDGRTMTEAVVSKEADATGLSWTSAGATSTSSSNNATINGRAYTNSVKIFGSATNNSNRYLKITVPTGYLAKFYIAGSTNSSSGEATLFIAKGESTGDPANAITSLTASVNSPTWTQSALQLPGDYYFCTDGSTRLYELSVQLYPIDYSRATTEGRYGTICLPNGGLMAGATLYEVAYYDEAQSKIFFDEIINGTMVAGRPYIFQPKEGADKLAVTYTDALGVTAGSFNGLVGFIGADEDAAKEVPVGSYILNNNQYRLVEHAGSAFIQSNRAYINLGSITTTPTAPRNGRRRVSMGVQGAQVATGIGNVQGDEVQSAKVLINGQLFILRGEKMYDATGRLVK